MDLLLEKYNDYKKLIGCTAQYELADNTIIKYTYKEENFAHLLGLHKLDDIQLIQFWLDRSNKTVKLKDVLKRIKNGTFTDAMVKASVHYSDIEDRYNSFTYDNLSMLNYTDAIIDFDASIIKSLIKSDYILFEQKQNGEYNHMGIGKDAKTGERYVETFFHEATGRYVSNQKIVKIKSYKLFDVNSKLIFEDSF